MRNKSAKYKFSDFFYTDITKLLSSIVFSNYINSAQNNWNNYSIIHDSNSGFKDNNDSIDKDSNCPINSDNLDELYGIYDWAKDFYLE